MTSTLREVDPELHAMLVREKQRQRQGLELIASENFTSAAVMECLGSSLTNKYSEGQPGARYYGGNEVIDDIENLCKRRALQTFGLSSDEWGVNVQPYSGSPANFAVYSGLLEPHGRIMGLDLPSGGHLSHGFYTPTKKITCSSKFFESLPYAVDPKTSLVDFPRLQELAKAFRPKLIICGFSAYTRHVDFARFREVADAVGAMLLADIAHIAGLVAAGEHPSPFPHADVVTTTTHKTLRGPRSALIFYNMKRLPHSKDAIDGAVFPGLQGGPHNHQIAAVATQLREVQTAEFRDYAARVVRNSKALAKAMGDLGFEVVGGGTDNHIVLVDVRPMGILGSKVEKICEACDISLNKNAIAGDVSAMMPGGVRIGSAAMTTRGCNEADFHQIARFIREATDLAVTIQASHGKKLVDFMVGVAASEEVLELRRRVVAFASSFFLPGLPGDI